MKMMKVTLLRRIAEYFDHFTYKVACWRMRSQFRKWKLNKSKVSFFLDKDKIITNNPLVSVVVLCYNNLNITKLCLESIINKTNYPNFELIVVDNYSTDGTPKHLSNISASYKYIKPFCLSKNIGFSKGINFGVEQTKGDILILLNNDIIVTTNWMNKFVNYLNENSTGLIGPITNFSGNETRIPIGYVDLNEMEEFANFYTSTHQKIVTELEVIPFHCVAMRKEVWDIVGPLDEQYGLGMFEDDDYSLRVRKLGFKNICADDIYVHHWGRSSFSKLNKKFHDRLFIENRNKYETKWYKKWKPHKHRSNCKYIFCKANNWSKEILENQPNQVIEH